MAPFQISRLVKHIERGKHVLRNIPAMKACKGNSLVRNLATFLADGLALAGSQRRQEVLEITVIMVMPVELASDAM